MYRPNGVREGFNHPRERVKSKRRSSMPSRGMSTVQDLIPVPKLVDELRRPKYLYKLVEYPDYCLYCFFLT